jgi:NADP-dependent aldehyde dehydrogenase
LTSELDAVLDAATGAAEELARLRPSQRASLLDSIADALEAHADALVPLAQRETQLSEGRLRGELARTTHQLRMFGDVLNEGSYLAATVDTPDDSWQSGARPDLRRMLVPLGPTVVFAASNFPFAFSVAGGDTASALAAGCPVIMKSHPGHPELSERTAEVVETAASAWGAPAGTFARINDEEAGRAAVLDPRVRAGAFTGSLRGGRALFELATSRPDPIPFYAEMGSVNPTFVTPCAAEQRLREIAEGFLNSFTLGVGQFCTKPGLLLVPSERWAAFEETLVADMARCPAAPMLNERITEGFTRGVGALSSHPEVRVVVEGHHDSTGVSPTLLSTTAKTLLSDGEVLTSECFGPVSLLVGYDTEEELRATARIFRGELTATLHGSEDEPLATHLFAELSRWAGRLVWNGWPTGVSVTHAMQHGGPFPATTAAATTSVGAAAIERFLRPVCFQNTPQALLPEALRADNPLAIPRRVNGRLELPR